MRQPAQVGETFLELPYSRAESELAAPDKLSHVSQIGFDIGELAIEVREANFQGAPRGWKLKIRSHKKLGSIHIRG